MENTLNADLFYVILNDEPLLEFDRKKPVPGHQRQYLDNMDSQMDQGIQLGDDFIRTPNPLQRSQFVANSLINLLLKDEYSMAIAMCTYLAKRMPELQQVKAQGKFDDKENDLSIELVFDRSYEKSQQEQTINFH
ncbi:MAG: hypothetical protein V3V19_09175 [Cocleimonas sp.]